MWTIYATTRHLTMLFLCVAVATPPIHSKTSINENIQDFHNKMVGEIYEKLKEITFQLI